MSGITLSNFIAELLVAVPEYEIIHTQYVRINSTANEPTVLFEKLAGFLGGIYYKEHEGPPLFDNSFDVVKRLMDYVEESATSESHEIVEGVTQFARGILYLSLTEQELLALAGPITKNLLEAEHLLNPVPRMIWESDQKGEGQ
jgi:hypothetical protein